MFAYCAACASDEVLTSTLVDASTAAEVEAMRSRRVRSALQCA